MKILFLGVDLDRDFHRLLLGSGVSVETAKRARSATGGFDLIAFKPKTISQLADLKALRKNFPAAWIAIVLPGTWLKDAEKMNLLLATKEKDEVWVEEHWEKLFWFSYQRLGEASSREQLKRMCEDLTRQSEKLVKRLEHDLALAGNLQRSLLPKASPEIPGLSIAVRYLPAAGAGGDYYDIFEFGDKRRFGMIMADAATHGMAATLLSVLIKVRLEEMKDRFPDSKSFVEFLNREIREMHGKDLASLSLFYGILDRASLTFHYTVAGSIRPILFRAQKPVALPIATNPALGGVDHSSFQENILRLQPGDLMLFHTDGLNAPLGGSANDKILELLNHADESTDPADIRNEILGLIDRHTEKKALQDDITLIHFTVNERVMYLAK